MFPRQNLTLTTASNSSRKQRWHAGVAQCWPVRVYGNTQHTHFLRKGRFSTSFCRATDEAITEDPTASMDNHNYLLLTSGMNHCGFSCLPSFPKINFWRLRLERTVWFCPGRTRMSYNEPSPAPSVPGLCFHKHTASFARDHVCDFSSSVPTPPQLKRSAGYKYTN